MNILDIARRYADAGFSVLPIKVDGSKSPSCEWTLYQRDIAGPDELSRMFSNGSGIGIICGRVSGNLEVLDFDAPEAFDRFTDTIKAKGLQDLLSRIVQVKTPRGRHGYYRCEKEVGGNQKLAQGLDGEQRIKTLIETRGEGGYVLAPGCPPACHQTGRQYEIASGDILNPPVLTSEERDILLSTARSLNQRPADPKEQSGGRPGDDFCARTSWAEILEPAGWKSVGKKGEEENWQRPGKDGRGASATVNYKGSDLLYVFSSNTPFETGRGYSKFSAYALLNHGGDFTAASRALRSKGYGETQSKISSCPNLAGKIREYIESIEGTFHTFQLYQDLAITDPRDKNNARVILNRLKGTQIQAHGSEAGCWRVIRGELKEMDFAEEVEELDLRLPLDLSNYVAIMPGNEIVITGDPDSGKTAFLLRTIRENLDRWECFYFNSEMGSAELKKRLELFKDFPIRHPHFHAYERSDAFEDVIRPGRYVLNIVDYLEITDEFYLIGKKLADIYRALNGAIAIIAIQKRNQNSDMPLGAQRALEKPRLAISLANGRPNKATIIKCKNRKTEHSLIGASRTFHLIAGCEFRSDSPVWSH